MKGIAVQRTWIAIHATDNIHPSFHAILPHYEQRAAGGLRVAKNRQYRHLPSLYFSVSRVGCQLSKQWMELSRNQRSDPPPAR